MNAKDKTRNLLFKTVDCLPVKVTPKRVSPFAWQLNCEPEAKLYSFREHTFNLRNRRVY